MYKKLSFYLPLLLILRGYTTQAQVTLYNSNLPIIEINTNGQTIYDDPKITANMRFMYNANGYTTPTDSANLYYGKIGIELRGSTSQSLSDKKPYSIELRDDAGQNREVALFGWTKIEDYALIAPYSDKSLMRDALTYKLAGSFMAYAPLTRFCELILNGNYQGVYVLTENIKRKRLGIAKMDPTTTGDALTGGYIVKIDKTTAEKPGVSLGFSSNYTNSNGKYTPFIFDYPEPADITSTQANYITSAVRNFESALKSPQFASETEGYAKYFDVQSLIDFFIINELTRNVDGYRLSTYFYKDKNSVNPKFKMGPVWDFNIALGNANYCNGGETWGWAYKFNDVCPGDGSGIPFWWDRLMEDINYRTKLKGRWKELRQNKLSNNTILGVVDSFETVLSDAQFRNFTKWRILNSYIWPNRRVNGSYPNEVAYLRNWLIDRLAWLDGEINALITDTPEINKAKLEVFPNPVEMGGTVHFNYNIYNAATTKVQLDIYNTLGQIIDSQTIKQDPGKNSLIWKNNNAKGVFYYKLYFNSENVASGKVLKL